MGLILIRVIPKPTAFQHLHLIVSGRSGESVASKNESSTSHSYGGLFRRAAAFPEQMLCMACCHRQQLHGWKRLGKFATGPPV